MAVRIRIRHLSALSVTALLSVAFVAVGGAPAHANGVTFVVDQTTASFTPLPGELSWAIEQANLEPGPDTIDIQVDLIELGNDLPDITDDLTLLGNGVTIDADNFGYRALTVWDAAASIEHLTVLNPNSSGVFVLPAVGSTVVLTDVNVDGAASYAGISVSAEAGSLVQIVGGAVTNSNGGIELSGSADGVVEVTATQLVGNSANNFGISLSGDTSAIIDGVTADGDGTTATGIDAQLYGTSQLTVRGSVISGNLMHGVSTNVTWDATLELLEGTELSGNGGAGVDIYAGGHAVIDEVTIAGNGQSTGDAGIAGMLHSEGALVISRTTASGNSNGGMAVELVDDAVLDIVNSTISGNDGFGIMVQSAEPFRLRHSTITANDGPGAVLGSTSSGSLITHTIIAGNGVDPQGAGELVNLGVGLAVEWSMIGPLFGNTNLDEGDGVQWDVTDPGLAPLADNGGPTLTHLPDADSAAVDAGDPNIAGAPATDQRGWDRIFGAASDIGARELQPAPVTDPAADGIDELPDTGAAVDLGLLGALLALLGGIGLVGYRAARRSIRLTE